ncbi:MAG: aminoacyl-tRNA hydrolase [Betaproteobacteria bacterium]|nr:aminoacyl-tRNA hydrolase [Betaproteobacteria bacterium]MBI3938146.1 aminoacyl-tRNA hydrolase [Betaproteobacteria bacterium]
MKLVVGLGNPGRKYEATRHNAGYWWIDQVAAAARCEWRGSARFHGWVCKLALPRERGLASVRDWIRKLREPREVWLLKPDTYMNESGRAVATLASYYRIAPEQMLIVHDDLDLPPGTARLKKGGGTAGHNGLDDVAAQLGTKDFWRLRLGIGHPGSRDEVVDYVLKRPGAEERAAIEHAIARSLEVWPLIAEGDHQAAMLKLHTRAVKGEG